MATNLTATNAAHFDANQVPTVMGVIGSAGTADVQGTAKPLPIGVREDSGAMYVYNLGPAGSVSLGNITGGTINRVETIGTLEVGSISASLALNTGTITTIAAGTQNTLGTVGTVIGVGTLTNVGSFTNGGTIKEIANIAGGTITTTLALNTGTITTIAAGTQNTLGTVGVLNAGTINALAAGTITGGTLTNLVSGTINAIASGTITAGTFQKVRASVGTNAVVAVAGTGAIQIINANATRKSYILAHESTTGTLYIGFTAASIGVGTGIPLVGNQLFGADDYTGTVFGIMNTGTVNVNYMEV